MATYSKNSTKEEMTKKHQVIIDLQYRSVRQSILPTEYTVVQL